MMPEAGTDPYEEALAALLQEIGPADDKPQASSSGGAIRVDTSPMAFDVPRPSQENQLLQLPGIMGQQQLARDRRQGQTLGENLTEFASDAVPLAVSSALPVVGRVLAPVIKAAPRTL